MTYENGHDNQDQLDETLDDLADAPEQRLFPAGAYELDLRVARISGKPGAYAVNFTHVSTVELADPTEESPNAGDQTALFIYTRKKDGTANTFGQGDLKKILVPIAAMLGTNSVNDCLAATKKGLRIAAVLGVRKSKDPKYDDAQTLQSIELI